MWTNNFTYHKIMNTWKLFTYLSIIGQPSGGHDAFAYPDGPNGPVTLPLHIYGPRRFHRDLDRVNCSSGCEGSDGQMAIPLHIPLQGGSTELENEFAKRLYSKSVRESSGAWRTLTLHIYGPPQNIGWDYRFSGFEGTASAEWTDEGRKDEGWKDGRTKTILYTHTHHPTSTPTPLLCYG